MSVLADRLTKENKGTKAKTLKLANFELSAIPTEVGELLWLETLHFSNYRHDPDSGEGVESASTGLDNQPLSGLDILLKLTNLRTLSLKVAEPISPDRSSGEFLDAMSETRMQDEYNKAVRDCDVFVALFFTKAGRFTDEEFETAWGQFKASGKPKIFTYFKTADINLGKARPDDLNSLWDFQDKLKKLGHFQSNYNSSEDLKLQFRDQLRRLIDSHGEAKGRGA